jgi:hypothetical protein
VFESGPLVVLWEASDPDGDELRLYLQYSSDNGQTWQSLLTDLNESAHNSIVLEDLQGLPGGDQAIFRITVVDGINSASDTSDAPFTLPDQAPQVYIMSPGYFAQYPTNELVRMQGSVLDLEDGPLSGDSLQWESDVDGPLGSGESIDSTDLSPGIHKITLRATDSAGNIGESQVEIYIDPNVARDKPSEEQFAMGLAVLHGEIPDFSKTPAGAVSNQAKLNTLYAFLVAGAVLLGLVALIVLRIYRRSQK